MQRFFAFYQILIVESNQWQCNELKGRKNAFPSREFVLIALSDTIFK